MSGFTKPSVLVRDAKVKLTKALGGQVPADTRRGWTDKMEVLSPGVLIGYNKNHGPTAGIKTQIEAGAARARRIMRKANNELASVVMLRQKESTLFTDVMDQHFGLIAGDDAGGFLKNNVVNKKFSLHALAERDRRWALERVRRGMLSISAHLNTGVYLIDSDRDHRDIRVGQLLGAPAPDDTEEAYVGFAKTSFDATSWRPNAFVQKRDFTCGFTNGEIHLHFKLVPNYTDISLARIIIHEATHKYLGTRDHAYAHEATYGTLNLQDTLENADSFAWAAVSLYCGSVKMGSPADEPVDWAQCTKP